MLSRDKIDVRHYESRLDACNTERARADRPYPARASRGHEAIPYALRLRGRHPELIAEIARESSPRDHDVVRADCKAPDLKRPQRRNAHHAVVPEGGARLGTLQCQCRNLFSYLDDFNVKADR